MNFFYFVLNQNNLLKNLVFVFLFSLTRFVIAKEEPKISSDSMIMNDVLYVDDEYSCMTSDLNLVKQVIGRKEDGGSKLLLLEDLEIIHPIVFTNVKVVGVVVTRDGSFLPKRCIRTKESGCVKFEGLVTFENCIIAGKFQQSGVSKK